MVNAIQGADGEWFEGTWDEFILKVQNEPEFVGEAHYTEKLLRAAFVKGTLREISRAQSRSQSRAASRAASRSGSLQRTATDNPGRKRKSETPSAVSAAMEDEPRLLKVLDCSGDDGNYPDAPPGQVSIFPPRELQIGDFV